jgi:hypothetical protein
MKRHLIVGILLPLLLAFLAGVCAAKAFACDPGQFYDPNHPICAPYAPANQPGWGPREVR